jgi:hypothetical protein
LHLKTLTIPLLAIAALSSVPASAGFINFDNLAAGVIVTNQYQAQGVVFTPSGSGLSSRITNVQIGEFGTAPFFPIPNRMPCLSPIPAIPSPSTS